MGEDCQLLHQELCDISCPALFQHNHLYISQLTYANYMEKKAELGMIKNFLITVFIDKLSENYPNQLQNKRS